MNVRIFNEKTNDEILINGELSECHDWDDDNPYIKFKIPDISWFNHTFQCPDCGNFIKNFGTDTKDWFIEYESSVIKEDLPYYKKKRCLDMSVLDEKYNNNNIKSELSYWFTGTSFKLKLQKD